MRAPLLIGLVLVAACLPAYTPKPDSGPLSLGGSCELGGFSDPCASAGLVCTSPDQGFTGTCQYPEFGDACLTSVGCDPDAGSGLTCLEFTVDGGPQAVQPFCGTQCSISTDCPHQEDACYIAYLPDSGVPIGGCEQSSCDTPDAPCKVDSNPTGGTCIPIDTFGDNVCSQAGPISLGDSCSETPIDGGAYLCRTDTVCRNGPSGETACVAICGGSITCPANSVCVPDYQFCLQPCSNNPNGCSSPFTCLTLVASNGAQLGQYCWLP